MKKVILTLAVPFFAVAMIGADFRREGPVTTPPLVAKDKKPCYGYVIIEFGKGINCDGDTVKLVKVNGGQELEK
jgi:hypothetical protein